MAVKTLLTVRGQRITENPDGSVSFLGEMTIDADGSARAYHPEKGKGLDYLGNAGIGDGRWWGIAMDSRGKPIIQGPKDPYPGYYVSTTAYEHAGFEHGDPRRYLDSEKVPFIVVPGPLRNAVRGVVLGCKATVTDMIGGAEVMAVVGDIGPATHLGEASIAVADALGIPSDPKKGGSSNDKRFLYRIFPGIAAKGFRLIPA